VSGAPRQAAAKVRELLKEAKAQNLPVSVSVNGGEQRRLKQGGKVSYPYSKVNYRVGTGGESFLLNGFEYLFKNSFHQGNMQKNIDMVHQSYKILELFEKDIMTFNV
jgi:hypothetical protein